MTRSLTLRPASIDDNKMLLEWRNDLDTRRSSYQSDLISIETHMVWLNERLANPSGRLWIAEEKGVAVGTIRSDPVDSGWKLSWTVAPLHRRRSIGKIMLRAAVGLLDGVLLAEIRSDNVASLRVAAAVGFEFNAQKDGMTFWSYQKRDKNASRDP